MYRPDSKGKQCHYSLVEDTHLLDNSSVSTDINMYNFVQDGELDEGKEIIHSNPCCRWTKATAFTDQKDLLGGARGPAISLTALQRTGNDA